jgi:hypothetical protein
VEKTESAIKAFDGFLYVDEFAESLFARSGKPAIWVNQSSDDKFFYPRTPFESRHNHVYFRATLTNFGIEGLYNERRALIEKVRNSASFNIHERHDSLSDDSYANELAMQRFVLRTASNCNGYVENFWNAIASGCVVFHQKLPATEVKSIGLLKPDVDFLEYDAARPNELIKRCEDVLRHWQDYKVVAETGRQTFLAKYTLRIFLQRLLRFADEMVVNK